MCLTESEIKEMVPPIGLAKKIMKLVPYVSLFYSTISCCWYMVVIIRKYGSTFYIGIAMVVLPYFGPWEN